MSTAVLQVDGLDWVSPGGDRYRAPHSANKHVLRYVSGDTVLSLHTLLANHTIYRIMHTPVQITFAQVCKCLCPSATPFWRSHISGIWPMQTFTLKCKSMDWIKNLELSLMLDCRSECSDWKCRLEATCSSSSALSDRYLLIPECIWKQPALGFNNTKIM